ncbi:hypothetical protein GmarT_26900 [Gimesia maris]|uniref:Carboxypeptidase regulatory-like domain-containing protein n=2 Tax=Gimesia maris TaxID=122 RepID=A0ABX5YMM1_9PLAN|nr:hypothetical protein GmarT_26900 [Gimesia maris]
MQCSTSLKLIPVLILSFTLSACGSGLSDTPPMAPVKGVVTLDGKPLTTGTIQFTPDKDRGTTGRMALGGIKEDGTFELMGDGAQVGHHLVSIECYESSAFDPNQPVNQAPKSLIPLMYTDPKKSEITAQVQAGEENHFTFELKSKP